MAIILLFLASCKATEASTHTEAKASYTTKIGRIERTDSILHPYKFHFVRYFDVPTGQIEREELHQEGELMQTTQQLQDTITIIQRDTIYQAVETTTAPAPTPAVTAIKSTLWGLLIGVALTIFAYLAIKFRKRIPL